MKKIKISSDLIFFIGLVIAIIGGCIITYDMVTEKINSCTTDPLIFALNEISLEEDYNIIIIELYEDDLSNEVFRSIIDLRVNETLNLSNVNISIK